MPKTTQSSYLQSRAWIFTINWSDDQMAQGNAPLPKWDAVKMVQMVYQTEKAPTTNRIHYQGCVKFKNMTRLQAVKCMIGCDHAHLEICRNWEKALDYCKKEDTRLEGSNPTEHGTYVKAGSRTDLSGLVAQIKSGAGLRDIADSDPVTFMRLHRGIAALRLALQPPPAILRKAFLLVGSTGVGKTRFVMDHFGKSVYNVFDIRQPWFDGYDGETTALLDECGQGMMGYNYLKQLTDRYPLRVPQKGGSAPWMATKIFLTSNEDICHWYPGIDTCHLDALQRRIKTYYLPHDMEKLKADALEEVIEIEDDSHSPTPTVATAQHQIDDGFQELDNLDC